MTKIMQFKGTWRNYQARVLSNAMKYLEDGKPSDESLGDAAWVVLSFLKAHELGVTVGNSDLLGKALLSIGWMEDNIVADRLYYGSFEDVGGINNLSC